MAKHSKERMARSQLYVDRAVEWLSSFTGRYASPIISQGFPDQGDALVWRLKDDEEKYWFRTVDAKEAHQWTDDFPPESWGGLMLTRDGQLHGSWIYIVINEPMTMLAMIDMEQWSSDLAQEIDTVHPETKKPQISMKMPINCFTYHRLKES